MRVVEMNPKKERSSRAFVQPGQGATHHLFAASLEAMVVVFARSSPMESGVVDVKAAFESRSQFLGVEYQRPHKCRRPVAILVKDVGQIRQSLVESISHVVHMTELRVGSSENGGVRRGSQRHLGIGAREDRGLAGHGGRIW